MKNSNPIVAPAAVNVNDVKQIPFGMTGKPERKAPVDIALNVYAKSACREWSEFAYMLMYAQAHMIAYVALDTIYQKTKHPKIRQLRNDCATISRLFGIDVRADAVHATFNMMESVKHTYKIKRLPSGKRFRVETKPYTTKRISEYGKDNIKTSGYALSLKANLDGEEVIQEAALRFCELYNAGLIQSFNDLTRVYRLVWRRVNRYIGLQVRRDKKQAAKARDDNGLDLWIKAPESKKASASDVENRVINADTKAAVVDVVKNNVHHNVDKKQVERVLSLLVDGYTQAEIADITSINKMSVSRTVKTIEKAALKSINAVNYIISAPLPEKAPVPVVVIDAKPEKAPVPVVNWQEFNGKCKAAKAPDKAPVPVVEKQSKVVYVITGRVFGSYKPFVAAEYDNKAKAEKALAKIKASAKNSAHWIETKAEKA